MYYHKTPAERTTARLQVAVTLIGIMVALFVIAFVGKTIAHSFNDFSDRMGHAPCQTINHC